MSDCKVDLEQSRTSAGILAAKDQVVSSFKLTEDGYQGEIYLPFTAIPQMGAAIRGGKEISFSVTFGDCDDSSSVTIVRVSSVNYPLEENKRTPASMGKLKCV